MEVKNLAEFSKLAKYCKLTLLQDELERAYNKANEFGEKVILPYRIPLLFCCSADQKRSRDHGSSSVLNSQPI